MKNEQYIARMKACIKRVEESECVEEQYFAAGFFESLMQAAVDDQEIDSNEFESYIELRNELFDLFRRIHGESSPMFIHYAIKLEGECQR